MTLDLGLVPKDIMWSIDGVSLHTFANNITTLGGTDAPPKPRGSDQLIPFSIGERPVRNVVGSRVIPFAMWVRGTRKDGTPPASGKAYRKFDDNWRELRNMLWNENRPYKLTKHFWYEDKLRSASAMVKFNDGLELTMSGRTLGRFTVDLKLTDPYFYDDIATDVTLDHGESYISLPGDAHTSDIQLSLPGPRSVSVIRVNEGDPQEEMSLTYDLPIPAGDRVDIDIKNANAITTQAEYPAFNSSGYVRHFGANEWLMLKPGANLIDTGGSGSQGHWRIIARGAWL